MWMVISVSFVVIAAILGVTEILRRFWLFLMRPKQTPPAIMVITLKKDIAVQQLRYALEFLSWEKSGDFSLVAVITSNLDEKEIYEIQKIVNSRSDAVLYEELNLN